MNVQFLPEARAELLDAVAYYEGELSGLTHERIEINPKIMQA